MPVATTFLKTILIAGGVYFFLNDLPPERLLSNFALWGVLFAAGLHLAARVSSSVARWIPNPLLLWSLPLFALGLYGRLQLELPVPEPPPLFYSVSPTSASGPPVYDRSLIAEGTVRRWIGPRLYLVDLRLTETQRKVRRRYSRKRYRRSESEGKRRAGRRRSYSKKSYRNYNRRTDGRRSKAGQAKTNRKSNNKSYKYKKNQSYRKRYEKRGSRKKYYKKRKGRRFYRRGWSRGRSVPKDQAFSFPVLTRVNADDWHAGCRLRLRIFGRGTPRRPQAKGTATRGFAAYVKRKGAADYLRLSRKYHVTAVDCPRPNVRFRARRRLDTILKRSGVTGPAADVARGLLLGRSGYLGRDLKTSARELGILHVFAASGLHLGIFFACLALPLGLALGRRHWLTFCAPLPLCFAYLYLLDFPVSLTRACLFLCLYALQSRIPVYMPPLERLLNTALLAMLVAPRELCSLSGALSFGAVGGILFFFPALQREILRPKQGVLRWVAAQAAVSTTASLATTPALLYAFGAYSYGSPLANLVVVPLVSLLLPLLYGLVALESLPAVVTNFAAVEWYRVAARLGLEGFVALTGWLEPFAFFREYDGPGLLPLFYTLVLTVGLMLTVLVMRRGGRARRHLVWLRRFCLAAILLLGPPGYFLEEGAAWIGREGSVVQFLFMVVKCFPEWLFSYVTRP